MDRKTSVDYRRTILNSTILMIFCCLSFYFGCCQSRPGWEYVENILSQIRPPEFANQDFTITQFGAVGDGKTDCTRSFKEAIDACHRAGGGRIIVPEGRFLSGSIHLKSHVNLHITKGGSIVFSVNPLDYLPIVYTRFEGVECMNYSPFIYAFEAKNIAITGKGILDGQATKDVWWDWKGPWGGAEMTRTGWEEGDPDQREDIRLLGEMAEASNPVEDRIFGEGHYLRPNFIQPYRCHDVLIEDITLINSPMWCIHPVLCTNVTVKGVTIESQGPNNDGCNPESCKNVLIKDCYINTGDDCIAIKSGRNWDGRRVNTPSENIVIQGCHMKNGHGGVTMGSEVSGSVRNVFTEECIMDSPFLERALRIKTNSLRGGIIENIFMRNVSVGEVSESVIRINMFYGNDRDQFYPIVRHINVQNVTCRKAKFGFWMRGDKNSPIEDVVIKDCRFNGVEKIGFKENVRDLDLDNVTINGELVQMENHKNH